MERTTLVGSARVAWLGQYCVPVDPLALSVLHEQALATINAVVPIPVKTFLSDREKDFGVNGYSPKKL